MPDLTPPSVHATVEIHPQKLDSALGALEAGTGEAEHHVEAVLAEIEDLMSYCNDIMDTGTAQSSLGNIAQYALRAFPNPCQVQ